MIGATLSVSSDRMKRGHPILLARSLWPRVLSLLKDSTLRDVIRASQDDIHSVVVDNDSVLHDHATPEDYETLIHRSSR
jgi:CTP:molybdopterin cytidylyltransferase MocA